MSMVLDMIIWVRDHSVIPMLLVFLLILVSAYAPQRKAYLQRQAFIPLRDDE